MGIPKYFRAISERFPLINQTINMGLRPEIDCLYLDMNGIVHTATHANGSNDIDSMSEDQMFLQIFQYIETLVELAEPQKLLYMALDGVAPRAKMNQQRQRRFRSGQALQHRIEQSLQAGTDGEVEVFDTNCITPGTEFMDRLSAHIQYYIRRRMREDKKWQKLNVIFSGSDAIGEGEHKIMAYIRAQRMREDYDPNLRHCIYGLDADLIMLALVSHEHNTVLLREEVVFGDQGDKYKRRKHLLRPGQFQFLHISMFREYLDYDLNFSAQADWYDLDRVVDDFVLLSYLAGNDFLPSLPTIRIGLGSLDIIFAVYKQHIVEIGGYLSAYGSINIDNLIKYFQFLCKHEPEMFHAVNDDIARINEFKAEKMQLDDDPDDLQQIKIDPITGVKFYSAKAAPLPDINNPVLSVDALFGELTLDDKDNINKKKFHDIIDQKADEFLSSIKSELTNNDDDAIDMHKLSLDDLLADDEARAPSKNDDFDTLLNKGFYYDEEKDQMIPIGAQYTIDNYYYKALPDVARGGKDAVNQLCLDYIEGLYWVYKYYYQCVPSWKWQYIHYEAPLLTSLAQVNPSECKFEFDIGEPFTPLQQLMGVLPPQSANLLPKPLRPLMLDQDTSPIAAFYPLSFDVDMTGKRWEHEGVAKIPFIDEALLIKTMELTVPNLNNPFGQRNNGNETNYLSPNENRRNINSRGDMLFQYDPTITTSYSLIEGYTQMLKLTGDVNKNELKIYEGNPEKANLLYFSDLPQCPVKVTLYINEPIPMNPKHLFQLYGQYTVKVDGKEVPNADYENLIATKYLDNPYVLRTYDPATIRTAFDEANQFDKQYLVGKILKEPRFVPVRLLFSQQPLPGFPTLKIIMGTYGNDPSFVPLRKDEAVVAAKNRKGGRNNRWNQNNNQNDEIVLDELFDAEASTEDPNAPYLSFGRPPILVFGKKSLMPSLSIAFTHDPHPKMYQLKYLEKFQLNDGLNNVNNMNNSAVIACQKSFEPGQFGQLTSVADRFPPGRVVWCDFPYLRPGRVEWISDGENVITPVSYQSVNSKLPYQISTITPYHKKLYYGEQQATLARYKHMLGLKLEPNAIGKVIVCIAPLLEMKPTTEGGLEPRFDTTYHPRKSSQASSQNGVSAQHGNLNPLPGYLFSIPQLLWASPPVEPDRRWMRTARQPSSGLYSTNTTVIGLTKDTYGYLGNVVEVLHPNDLTKMISNKQTNELSLEQLNIMVSRAQDYIRVNWTQIPPPVPLQLQVNRSGGVEMVERQNIFAQIAQMTKLRYYPAYELARALKISGKTLFRLTDSLYFKIRYRQYNVGLQFHAARHSLLLPDYCRYVNQWLLDADGNAVNPNQSGPQHHERSIGDSGDRWEYSQLAVLMLKKFIQTFPELFNYLDTIATNVNVEGNIDVADLLMQTWKQQALNDPDYEMPYTSKHSIPETILLSYYERIKTFINTLGLANAVMVSTTSRQLNTATVRKLEQLILAALTKGPDEDVVIQQATVANTPARPQQQAITLNAGQVKSILKPSLYTKELHIENNAGRFAVTKGYMDNAVNNVETTIFSSHELLLPSSSRPYCPLETLRTDQILLKSAFNKGGKGNRGEGSGRRQQNKQQFFKLCDRVMVSRSDVRIPLGATGTIIGLHSQFLPLTTNQAESAEFGLNTQGGEELFLELLLDEPTLVATTLRGRTSSPIGVLLPATSVLNLVQPVWMLENLVKQDAANVVALPPQKEEVQKQYEPKEQRKQQKQSEPKEQKQYEPKEQRQQQKPKIIKPEPQVAPVVAVPTVAVPVVAVPTVAVPVVAAPQVKPVEPVVAAPQVKPVEPVVPVVPVPEAKPVVPVVPPPTTSAAPLAPADNSIETPIDDFLADFD